MKSSFKVSYELTYVASNYFKFLICTFARISSDNNIDNSTEVLRAWLEKNGPSYHGYKAVLDEESKGFEGERGIADWTVERYLHIINLREAAFRAARAQWADYLWVISSNMFQIHLN